MRIAMVVRYFPRHSQTYVLNQITGLIDRGHQVDIFALDNIFCDSPKVHSDIQKYQLMKRAFCIPRRGTLLYAWNTLKSIAVLLLGGLKGWKIFLRSLDFSKYEWMASQFRLLNCAAAAFNKGPYDIVHCQFGNMGIWTLMLREIGVLNGKMIVSFRGHDITQFVVDHGRFIYNKMFEKADLLLPNCNYFKKCVLELDGDEKKMMILRSGIDINRYEYSRPNEKLNGRIKILSVGRIVEKKGFKYCVEAVSKLKKIFPNIEYSIIGDGSSKRNLEKYIRYWGAESFVHILGHRNQDELMQLLKDYHIFLAPSVITERGDVDGPTNTLKEAMAVGLPVISTFHGGIPELVEDGISGFLVSERDAVAIEAKLRVLIENQEMRVSMGQNGRKKVIEDYDNEKINDQLVEIYEKVLKS